MRFGSSSPRQHHHAHHHNHRPPLAYFLNEDGEQVRVAPARVRVVEYEYGRAPPGTQEENRYGAYEENVDREAEEFIRMEHKKFEKIKVMSMKSE